MQTEHITEEAARQDYLDNVYIELTQSYPLHKTKEERLQNYGLCQQCKQINTGSNWCKSCNAARFQNDFGKWASGNKEIDYFIQNTQIHAWKRHLILEWYSWSTFSEIEEIGKGGYATVFRAKRQVGRIKAWDHQWNQWSRIEKGMIIIIIPNMSH